MLRSAFWSSLDRVLFQSVNIILTICIARFLGPSQLGTVAIVAGYIYFLNIFVDSGLTISIIRNSAITDIEISSIFYFNLAVSLVLISVTLACSMFIEDYFQINSLGYYLNISASILFFNALTFVRYAKMEQRMDFKRLAIINLVSIFFSGVLCIVMLYYNYGIFAVILFYINSSLCKNLCYIFFTPKFVLSNFNFEVLKPHLQFGKNLLFSSSIEATYNHGFPILITHLFSGYNAGIFFQSKRLVDGPTNLISSAIRRLFLPEAAKFNNDLKKTNVLLLEILKIVNFILILCLGLVFINADFIIINLMGVAWVDSILILKILLAGMLFYPSFFLCLDVFKIQGNSVVYSRVIVTSRIISVVVVCFCSIFGFTSMVVAFASIQFIMYIGIIMLLSNKYQFDLISMSKTLLPFILISLPIVIGLDLLKVGVISPFFIACLKSICFITFYIFGVIVVTSFNPLKVLYSKFSS